MQSSIGMKFMMAVSGLLFVGFVLAHMYGNLKIFGGHEAFDDYAHHLRTLGTPVLPFAGALWAARIILILALIAHVFSAFTLWRRADHARQHRYAVKKAAAASISSKWMRWGGVTLLAFIVFHLAQFTFLWINVGGHFATPSERLVVGFQQWWLVLIYVIAMAALAMHIHHGFWSACQTLGFTSTKRAAVTAKTAGLVLAAVISIGFVLPPLLILFGAIK